MSNNTPLKFAFGIAAIMFALCLAALLPGCKSCNKPPEQPSVVQTITNEAQPAIDSLKREQAKLQVRIDSLTAVNKLLQEKKIELRYRVKESKQHVAVAEEKNDTAALVTALKNTVAEQEEYIKTADHDATVQGATIEDLTNQNKNLYAEKEMEKTKFNRLATATTSLEIKNAALEKKNQKTERKLKGWKKATGIVVLVAIAEGILLSIK